MKEQQRAYAVNDEFLLLHETEEGFAYTFLNADYTLRDGGVYDSAEDTIDTVLTDILEGAELHDENTMLLPLDYNEVYDAHCQAEEQKLKKALEPLQRPNADIALLTENSNNVRVEGCRGTWCVVDSMEHAGTQYFLLESEKHGNREANLIVNLQGKLVMDGAWNGFSDFEEAIDMKVLTEKMLTPYKYPMEERISTPYGRFHLTALTQEQMREQGYGVYHMINDEKYAIMMNGTCAFAVSMEPVKAVEPLQRPNADVALLTENSNKIRVEEHTGTWYVVDSMEHAGTQYFLLESEQHGDMAANLIVDANGKLALEDVYNGFDDLLESFPSLETEKEIPTPDQSLTEECIETPRGIFYVTSLTQEQMQAQGYGTHHMSDDRKYAIMGKGSRAFAVSMEPIKAVENPLQNAEMSLEQNYNMIDGVINNLPPEKEADAIGTIEYLDHNGDVAETVKFTNRDDFHKVLEENVYYGCPASITFKAPEDYAFFLKLDPQVGMSAKLEYKEQGNEKSAERPSLRDKMRTIDAQLKQKEQPKPREKFQQKER